MNVFEWAQNKTTEILKDRFKGWLTAYVGNEAAGYAADMAGQGANTLGAWAWEEFNPQLLPIRGILLLQKG